MARYRTDPIDFPEYVQDGAVVTTPAGAGKALVSLGRKSARGGVKHLGVFDQVEALAVVIAMTEEFGLESLLEVAKAQKQPA